MLYILRRKVWGGRKDPGVVKQILKQTSRNTLLSSRLCKGKPMS